MLQIKDLKTWKWEFLYLCFLSVVNPNLSLTNFYCLYYYYSVFKKRWTKKKKYINLRWKFRYNRLHVLPTRRNTRKASALIVFSKKFLKRRFKLLKRWVAVKRFVYFSKKHNKYKVFIQRFRKQFLASLYRYKKKRKIIRQKRKINWFKYNLVKNHRHITSRNIFSRWQRLFLSQKRVNKFCIKFLYHSVYKALPAVDRDTTIPRLKTKKIIYVNLHRSPIWKMRLARYAHWQLRTRGKLNEWRYHKLLSWELRALVKVITLQLLQAILLSSYNVILSWKQLLLLLKFKVVIFNGTWCSKTSSVQPGDIMELPFKLTKQWNKKPKRRFIRLLNRTKWLSYKRFLSRTNKKVRRQKYIPKLFKRVPVGVKKLGSLLAYDPSLNTFAVLYNLPVLQHNLTDELTHSSVLALQNWRYRFD